MHAAFGTLMAADLKYVIRSALIHAPQAAKICGQLQYARGVRGIIQHP
jgi:hypothetical protein